MGATNVRDEDAEPPAASDGPASPYRTKRRTSARRMQSRPPHPTGPRRTIYCGALAWKRYQKSASTASTA